MRKRIIRAVIALSRKQKEQDGPVAKVHTDTDGIAGFGIPADLQPAEISVQVDAEGFNSRHLQLDGTNLAIDLRELLYGVRAG